MIRIILGLFVVLLCGCGSGDSCEGVDTSQAPDSSIVSSNSVTYYWGDCSRSYPTK